jgi:hypothetical protein
VRLLELGCLLLARWVLILGKLGSLLLWQANLWAETSVHVWIVVEAGMLHDQAEVRRSALAIFVLASLGHFIKVDWSVVSCKLVIFNITHAVTLVFIQASVDALLGLGLRHLNPPTH